MAHVLVAYFSASGETERLAKTVAKVTGGDLYEVRPAVPYLPADLDWRDANSRSSREMRDAACRPAVAGDVAGMERYDTVFVGFPIWWYEAPRVVQTFLERYDFSGKTVVPFATSGGSGMGKTDEILQKSCSSQTHWRPGRRMSSRESEQNVRKWVEGLDVLPARP